MSTNGAGRGGHEETPREGQGAANLVPCLEEEEEEEMGATCKQIVLDGSVPRPRITDAIPLMTRARQKELAGTPPWTPVAV